MKMALGKQSKSGPEDRKDGRIEVTNHRVNATLAVILANRTMGCLVPLKDFSKTGVGLYSKVRVDQGTPIRLSIDGIESAPLEGRVVWCGSSAFDPSAPPSYEFRLGIEFTPKDDTAREVQMMIFRAIAKLAGVRDIA